MDRKTLEERVFEYAKEDLNATEEEIREAIDNSSTEELKLIYRRQKRARRYCCD